MALIYVNYNNIINFPLTLTPEHDIIIMEVLFLTHSGVIDPVYS
jgi:hypothetical protein